MPLDRSRRSCRDSPRPMCRRWGRLRRPCLHAIRNRSSPSRPAAGQRPQAARHALHRRGLQQDPAHQSRQNRMDLFHRPGWEYDDVWMLRTATFSSAACNTWPKFRPIRRCCGAMMRGRNGDPHLPAHRSGQGSVYPKRPAAQADGGEHQNQRGRGESCVARHQCDRSRARAVPSRALHAQGTYLASFWQ